MSPLSFPPICSDFSPVFRVRAICEAQPEMRLTRLLNRCQFDEAENFARQFDLDLQASDESACTQRVTRLQIVYKTRVNYLLNILKNDCSTEEQFGDFLRCLDAVQDDNLVPLPPLPSDCDSPLADRRDVHLRRDGADALCLDHAAARVRGTPSHHGSHDDP